MDEKQLENISYDFKCSFDGTKCDLDQKQNKGKY